MAKQENAENQVISTLRGVLPFCLVTLNGVEYSANSLIFNAVILIKMQSAPS